MTKLLPKNMVVLACRCFQKGEDVAFLTLSKTTVVLGGLHP